MKNQDKALTALVRSMKRNLEQQHGIKVPHAALRASYLQALGENPHAFAGRASTVEVTASQDAPVEASTQWRWLYLVEDDLGCLERLALDEEGLAKLPVDFKFQDARLVRQFAELPRVSKYGLPDYLSNAREFFGTFGLTLANEYEHHYRDLGDDSGDSCRIQLSMSEDQWQLALDAALAENAQFQAVVAEWVGLHYGQNFDVCKRSQRNEWTQRYLTSVERSDEDQWGIGSSDEPADVPQAVIFEYVYPDEDGDSVAASVDVNTGIISFSQALPADVHSLNVRTRIWVSEDGEPLESTGDGVEFEARFYRAWPAAGSWKVFDLQQLHFAQFAKN